MSSVHSAPPAGAAQLPKGPTLGSVAPKTVVTVNAAKATGTGGNSKGGGSKSGAQSNAQAEETENSTGLYGDFTQLSNHYGNGLGTLTIQAATSFFQGSSEVESFSHAQLAEFKSLLNRQRPRLAEDVYPSGNAYVVGGLGESTWFSVNSERNKDHEAVLAGMNESRNVVAAIKRPFVNLPTELAPQSAAEEARLFSLTTDPRSGFAPEGVAAWIAECRHGLTFERSHDATFDFVDSESKQGWLIAPAREHASRPIAEIQAAAVLAESITAHLLVDAAHLQQIEGALGVAVRELASSASDARILVVVGPMQHINVGEAQSDFAQQAEIEASDSGQHIAVAAA